MEVVFDGGVSFHCVVSFVLALFIPVLFKSLLVLEQMLEMWATKRV